MAKQVRTRRDLIAGLGAVATVGAMGSRTVGAQGMAAPAPFAPTLHTEDAWMSAMPGQHRVVMDVVTPAGMPDMVRFANNVFNAHKSGYALDEANIAVLVCLRHSATAYGYTDAIWSKYGKAIDTTADPPQLENPYNSANRMQLADLAKRGVQFMVCGMASRAIAGRIAGRGGDTTGVLAEITANLIPNARLVAAGVVGVMHAQERGFSMVYVG